MAKEKYKDDTTDMDNEEGYELDDVDEYELIPSRESHNLTKRRRIEELMEEKELRNCIFGDIY